MVRRYYTRPFDGLPTEVVAATDYDTLAAQLAEETQGRKDLMEELTTVVERLAGVIGYCAQEGHDGEPWDTINAIATGEIDPCGSRPSRSADPVIHAQHDETGRMWTGPRSQLPPRYAEVSADVTHASDCALHNAPALPVGPCDCGAKP